MGSFFDNNISNKIITYIFNRDEDVERWKHISEYNLNGNRIVPVKLDNPKLLKIYENTFKPNKNELKRKKEISNLLTFRDMVLTAKANKHKRIMRVEDDIIIMDGYEDTLSNLPDEFDICHLGLYIKSRSKTARFNKYNDYFVQYDGQQKTWGILATIINDTLYDKIIVDLFTEKYFYKTLDFYIQSEIIPNYKSFLAYPMVVQHSIDGNFVKDSIHNLVTDEEMFNKTNVFIKKMIN